MSKILTHALRYYDLGFSIIPIGNEKKPLIKWTKYQTERATPEQIKQWAEQFPDMNIAVVTGAVSGIVVIDVDEGGVISNLPPTATVKTGTGWHFYCRHPNVPVDTNAGLIAPHVDVRGDGGYAILPPSIHASGVAYEWTIPPEDGISELSVDLQQKLLSPIAAPALVGEVVTVGARNTEATKYAGRLLSHLPPDMHQIAGWASLKQWNQTVASPPLSEEELRGVFDSILARDNQKASKEIDFSTFTLSQLYQEQFPKQRWLVQDLIPFGSITALTGEAGSYKTFFTQGMTASITNGTPFLGQFAVTKGKILIIDEENQRRTIRERYECLGLTGTDNIVFLSLKGIKVDEEACLNKIQEVIEKEKPSLIVFDSLVRIHSGDENTSKDISRVFNNLRRLITEERSIIVIHHHRKSKNASVKSNNQSIRGSSDILAAVDTHLAVDRNEDEITVTQGKMRIQPEIIPFKVTVDRPSLNTTVFTYRGKDTTKQDLLIATYEIIKATLLNYTEPVTIDDLATDTGLAKGLLRQPLIDLVASGDINKAKVNGAHGAHRYCLPDRDDPEPEVRLEKKLKK